jgi:two-component system nitrogen regulation response regulator GlnG
MSNDTTMWGTERPVSFSSQASVYAATIAYHNDWKRIGATVYLDELSKGKVCTLSRLEPEFTIPYSKSHYCLDDRYVSRKPISIQQLNGKILITPHPEGTEIRIDGAYIRAPHYVFEERLKNGVVMELGGRVILVLHSLSPDRRSDNMHRMLGVSEGIEHIRRSVDRVADLNVPVLIRGETGTGKELVASALHNASPRCTRPMLAVNVGAIPETLAISELFGAKKGSFTGANKDKPGYFSQANNSTLFLDEIGDASDEVQVALLRTLETSEVRPVGGSEVLKVDVRMVAATDADLESKLESQDFRNPLLQRLAGFEIWIPRLAQRKPDIGLLLSEFLRFEFDAIAEQRHYQELDAQSEMLWYQFFRHALQFDWPGNIRQMRNVARQVAIHNRLASFSSIPARVEAMLLEQNQLDAAEENNNGIDTEETPVPSNGVNAAEANSQPAPAVTRRKPSTIDEAELMQALERQRWDLKNTAEDLNISRAALYKMIEANPNVRKAGDLSVDELTQSYQRCAGDLTCMVDELKVSKAALKRRIKELAIEQHS